MDLLRIKDIKRFITYGDKIEKKDYRILSLELEFFNSSIKDNLISFFERKYFVNVLLGKSMGSFSLFDLQIH